MSDYYKIKKSSILILLIIFIMIPYCVLLIAAGNITQSIKSLLERTVILLALIFGMLLNMVLLLFHGILQKSHKVKSKVEK